MRDTFLAHLVLQTTKFVIKPPSSLHLLLVFPHFSWEDGRFIFKGRIAFDI